MAIPLPDEVRDLFDAPNSVHLTLSFEHRPGGDA
jgi:hypothetical protein